MRQAQRWPENLPYNHYLPLVILQFIRLLAPDFVFGCIIDPVHPTLTTPSTYIISHPTLVPLAPFASSQVSLSLVIAPHDPIYPFRLQSLDKCTLDLDGFHPNIARQPSFVIMAAPRRSAVGTSAPISTGYMEVSELEKYQLISNIGKGSFGVISKVRRVEDGKVRCVSVC